MILKSIKDYILKNRYIFLILIVGFLLRIYGSLQNLAYSHDQDLQAWFIRDVLENRHLRLIGQETSTQGVFIGPLYYYLLIPFYILFDMDPVGGIVLATILGLITIWSFYFVFKKIFSERIGLLSAFFYATSFASVSNDRGVLPTTPVYLWCVWYLYALKLTLDGRLKTSFLIFGLLVGLIWHLNVSLVLLLPLMFIALLLSKVKRKKIKEIKWGVFTLMLTSLPFILFELRHNFSQLRHVMVSLSTNQGSSLSFSDQLIYVLKLAVQNSVTLIYNFHPRFHLLVFFIVLVLSLLIVKKHLISKNLSVILIVWQFLYVAFFSVYSKSLSEYYLNGMTLVWILVLVISFDLVIQKSKISALIIGAVFLVLNVNLILDYGELGDGYLSRRSIVQHIKKDSVERGFPCVSISYMTAPGYDRGYRYMYVLESLKIKPVSDKVPVYSIVYPQNPLYKVDRTFGSIGLIYPDFGKYNSETINSYCDGEDSNLIDPMIGLTK